MEGSPPKSGIVGETTVPKHMVQRRDHCPKTHGTVGETTVLKHMGHPKLMGHSSHRDPLSQTNGTFIPKPMEPLSENTWVRRQDPVSQTNKTLKPP